MSFLLQVFQLPALVLLVDNTWLCRHHAVYEGQLLYPGACTIPSRVEAYLIVIYEICPWQDMTQQGRVSAVPCRNALHVWCQVTVSIKWLPLLDFIYHLPHIHLDFSVIFLPAVEPYYTSEPDQHMPDHSASRNGRCETYGNSSPRSETPQPVSPSRTIT